MVIFIFINYININFIFKIIININKVYRNDVEDTLFDTIDQQNPDTFYNIIDIEGEDNILLYLP